MYNFLVMREKECFGEEEVSTLLNDESYMCFDSVEFNTKMLNKALELGEELVRNKEIITNIFKNIQCRTVLSYLVSIYDKISEDKKMSATYDVAALLIQLEQLSKL